MNVIANTYSFQDFKDNAVASGFSYQPSYNPFDKIVKLYEEKIELYERMLREKDEMMRRLEKLIDK